jgi:hypothetical protein
MGNPKIKKWIKIYFIDDKNILTPDGASWKINLYKSKNSNPGISGYIVDQGFFYFPLTDVPPKPILKKDVIDKPKFPEYKLPSPDEIRKRFEICSKGGVHHGQPHKGYTFYRLPNKDFTEGGWGCDEKGNKKSVSELINLGILKWNINK